jgi:hypothetical protein
MMNLDGREVAPKITWARRVESHDCGVHGMVVHAAG